MDGTDLEEEMSVSMFKITRLHIGHLFIKYLVVSLYFSLFSLFGELSLSFENKMRRCFRSFYLHYWFHLLKSLEMKFMFLSMMYKLIALQFK